MKQATESLKSQVRDKPGNGATSSIANGIINALADSGDAASGGADYVADAAMALADLIQAVALLHQYQREVKRAEHRGSVTEYIAVKSSDITLANRLAHEVLGRTLDEMPPQTRKLLVLLREMVAGLATSQNCQPSEVRFTRRSGGKKTDRTLPMKNAVVN